MKKLLISSFFLIQSSIALSSETLLVAPQKIQPINKEEPAKDRNETSLENRKNLKYQMTIIFLGREYIGNNPITLSTGHFINEKNLITLRYSNYNSSYSKDKSRSLRAITLGDRYFFGNSFNIMGSVYWKKNTILYGSPQVRYTYRDFGVGLRLGNEWQWKNFTIGCDWLGLNHTLIEQENTFIGEWVTDEALTVTYLSFYLGFSF